MPLQHFYEETIAYLLAGSIPFCFVPHREPKAEQKQPEPKSEKQQPEPNPKDQQPERKPEPSAEKSGSDDKEKNRDSSEDLFEQPQQGESPRKEVLFEQPSHSPSPSSLPSTSSSPKPPSLPPSIASVTSTETLVNEDETVLDEADLAFLLRPGRWGKATWWKQRKLPRWWWKRGEECGGQGKVEGCGRCGGKCRVLRVGKGDERVVVEVCDGCGEGRVI